jgi:tetratricopeptide (TPR) repeat protein
MRYLLPLLVLPALLLATPASAQMLVLGKSQAAECYQRVLMQDQGSQTAKRVCEKALKDDLAPKDEAATYVNLGVLQMRSGRFEESRDSYTQALKIAPKLPEAYINYGAALFYMGHYDESVDANTQAIDLDTRKMAEALYNRGLAYDALQNYKAAYLDFQKALSLKPDWELAKSALSRYDVKTRS